MSDEQMRTGANPADSHTPAVPAAFDLASFLEQQLTVGLALLGHASDIAGNGKKFAAASRNGAMGAAARLVLANARSAETLARLTNKTAPETVYRQFVEVKKSPARETEAAGANDIYLACRPTRAELAEHEALEAQRIAEDRPADDNTWWLRRYRDRLPFWAELGGGGTID